MSANRIETMKVVLFGDANVGKSSLLLKWTEGKFIEEYRCTIGVDFKQKVILGSDSQKQVKLQLWDTAGQEQFKSLTSTYLRGAQAVVLVFDVANRASFQGLSDHLKTINEYLPDTSVPIILLGNKTDLTNERIVSVTEGQEFAKQRNLIYHETSVKVEDDFSYLENILHKIWLQRRTATPIKPKLENISTYNIELYEKITKLKNLHTKNEKVQNICGYLQHILKNEGNPDLQKRVEGSMKELTADLNALRYTLKSAFNTLVNFAITVFLAVSIVGFPIAYLSGLLESNKKATGHSCMFFRFGEHQAAKAYCNEVFANINISCRV